MFKAPTNETKNEGRHAIPGVQYKKKYQLTCGMLIAESRIITEQTEDKLRNSAT